MFTTSHPRQNARSTTGRRIGAAAVSLTLACGFAVGGATSAQAADEGTPVATAHAQFLSGSLLGTDLDNVVMLRPAASSVDGDDATESHKDPLQATALRAINVGDGSSLQTSLGDLLQLGAIGQYSTASNDGTSMAWTGAVSPDGGIGVGKDIAVPGGNATLNLAKLLGDDFAANLTSLELAIDAVSSQAISDGDSASGKYSLAGLDLKLTSPAVSQLTQKVNTALDSVTNRLAKLDGSDGLLVGDLNNSLIKLNPALNLLGGNAHLSATVDTGDLKSLVQDLLQEQYGGKGISFNLETGVVTLNLAELAGENLNKMAPGTELLDAAVLDPALDSVTTKVSGIADQIVNRVRAALNNAKVTVHADLSQDIAQAPLVQKICETVPKIIQVPTQVAVQVPTLNGVPVVGGLLGGVTGTLSNTVTYVTQYVTQYVNKTVDQLVCSNKVTALPALNTSVTADITGTVNEFLTGGSIHAVATAKVLGIAIPTIDLDVATSQITDSLNDQLLDSDSAVTDLVTALNVGLVDPALQGLTQSTDSVGTVLSDVVSAKVNVQELSDGKFSETALVVRVLRGAMNLTGGRGTSIHAATDSSAARVNFARSTVGPNVTQVDEVGGVDTFPPTGDDPISGAASTISRLAITGAGITALVAAVLALLAAGAYLVRESYRRNHRPTTV